MKRRNFFRNILLFILAFLFGYSVKKVDDNLILSRDEPTWTKDMDGKSFSDKIKILTEQMDDITNYIEVEPDTLRESPKETDGDLLQKAINMADGNARKTVSIKLGRIYKIDKAIMLKTSIADKSYPHLIINGSRGGLQLAYNGFMFDGVKNSGGAHFQNVKFIGDNDYPHALFNCDNIIQPVFHSCQFSETNTILYANETDGYIQSGKFIGCNFKGMTNYQIVAAMAYDLLIANNIVEWGFGGLIHLTQQSKSHYCSIGLFITGNLIEGISGQEPIKLTHNGRCQIQSNYFERNSYTDIDMSGALLPHRGLSIKDNSFGDYTEATGKDSCVKVGKLYHSQGYDFSGNSGSKMIFDFADSNGNHINLTGGMYLYDGSLSYKGINNDYIFYGIHKKKAKIDLLPAANSFEFTIQKKGNMLLSGSYYVKVNFNRKGSKLYQHQYAGYLYFISGYNAKKSKDELEVKFKPVLIQSGQSFSEDVDLSELNVTFKSSQSNRIPFTSFDVIKDTIIIENANAHTNGANVGYAIDIESLIMN